METIPALEVIGGYKVHPAASQFPLMEGNAFDEISSSIEEFGLIHPIVLKGDLLIDGRNRLRAATKLNTQYKEENRSHRIKITTVELPADINNVAEYIYDINISRRHLTTDQQSAIGAAIMPLIAQEREAKQVASQFKAGDSRQNPGGKPKAVVNTKPYSPETRDIKKMNEQSTVGQIAKLAKVSHHKARQTVAMVKAVQAGELPKDTVAKVIAGEMKLKDVVPKRVPKPKTKKAADEPVPDKEKDDAFENVKTSIDRYLDIDFSSKKLLREKIDTYLISKGN
jgi:hypothetical protein